MAKGLSEVLDEQCAFDRGNGSCSALNIKDCESCRFRKTEKEIVKSRERAAARIKTFPKDYQAYIKSKYSQREQRY